MDGLRTEFLRLREQAHKELKNIPESGSHIRLFTLTVNPSFAPPRSYSLYVSRPKLKVKPVLSVIVWRSDLDGAKLQSPVDRLRYPPILEPTIESKSWIISDEFVNAIKEKLSDISIPPFFDDPMRFGCDGTSYEFEYNRLFFSLSISWWEDTPEKWTPFTKVVKEVLLQLVETENSASEPSE